MAYLFPDEYDDFEVFTSITDGDIPSLAKGSIKLNSGWNMIAIDVTGVKVYDYFIQTVGEDYIEICNTYVDGKWLNFIVGVTSENSSGNFTLVRDDEGTSEIQSFLCKVKPDGDGIIFDWTSEDSV